MPANTPPPHRQSSRKLADRILGIQIEPDNSAIILNVSDGGMGFRAISPLTQSGTIRFSFLENGRQVETSGELVWTDEARMTGGLSFASMPQATRERFRKWIDRADIPPRPWTGLKSQAPPAKESAFAGPASAPTPNPEVPRAGGAPIAPNTPPRQPPQAGFALFEDIPRGPGYAAWDQEPAIPRERSRFFTGFVAGAVFMAIVAAILFFTNGNSIRDLRSQVGSAVGANPVQTPEPTAAPVVPSPAATPPSNPIHAAAPSVDSAESQPPTAPPPIVNNDESKATPPAAAIVPSPPAAKENISVPVAAKPSPPAAEPGAEDLAIAERYLDEHPGRSGSATAAGYLWAAVKKGNVEAEITLAEMYIRGEGVPKNCGQARILLSAAAKKGSKTASDELAQLVRNGCR